MVIKTKHILAFFKLIRWPNLLMVLVTQYLVRICIISPMLEVNGFALQLSSLNFFLLVLSTILITAGGYVINDYFDRKTDLVNRPETVIVDRVIKRRSAIAFHIIFNGIGTITGFYLAYKINSLYLGLIFIGVSGILWFYSTTYKRQLLVGNIIVACLTALIPLMVLLFEIPILSKKYGNIVDAMGLNSNHLAIWVLGFSGFAFILTLIREIVKDTEDFEGDQAYGMQTVPIVLGIKWTKIILIALNCITLAVIFYVCLVYFRYNIASIYLILFLGIPTIYVTYLVVKANSKKQYHLVSTILKLMMIAGILFALVVRYLIFTL